MAYDDNNRGAIWKNDKRETDTQPHFKGQAKIDGIEYWVSAWKREADAAPNSPALKFSFTPKNQKPKQQPVNDGEPFNDDIPF